MMARKQKLLLHTIIIIQKIVYPLPLKVQSVINLLSYLNKRLLINIWEKKGFY